VPAHGARVLLREGRTEDAGLRAELDRAMAAVAGSLLDGTDSGR
jgi:hypothetical protein